MNDLAERGRETGVRDEKFRKFWREQLRGPARFTKASRNAWRDLVNPDFRHGRLAVPAQTTNISKA